LVKTLARVGVAIGVVGVLWGGVFTSRTITPSRLPLPAPYTVAPAGIDAPADRPSPDDSAAVDLFGNEVTDAIATYGVDPAGSLYELHSPQTELPRLGSPKS
jgi:hypothetical protein